MKFKTAAILFITWTVLALTVGLLGVRHMHKNPIRGLSLQTRTEQWGKGVGTIYVIGNFAIVCVMFARRKKE